MTPRRALLLFAIAQTARARSATLAAIASDAAYANRLYGSSNAIDMIGAETTLIVLLLWVAAAGRAPAVGCRGWHVRISI